MTINPNFQKKKSSQIFSTESVYARSRFSTEISVKTFQPTNGNFDSKSNKFFRKIKCSKLLKSRNRLIKNVFLKNPTAILTSTI